MNDIKKAFERLKQISVKIIGEKELLEKLESGKKLVIKFGADPSRPDIHIGHSVALRALRVLQDLGHTIAFVIGDFTGMIGDPSGKSKTRPSLTYEETRKNAQTYFDQVVKILDPIKTNIVFNSEWLSKLDFKDIISLTSKYTLAQILEREDFSNRHLNNQPIALHELMYPLIQGYDSVALNADVEVGGTDQTFNLLVGRELQKVYGQIPQEVIVFPLLPGLDGKEKMSKSLDNYIGIAEPATTMFEKCMKVPDELLSDYFVLTTDYDKETAEKLISENIREAHFEYARTLTTLYHNEKDCENAEHRYLEIASGNLPTNVEEITTSKNTHTLLELTVLANFASSNSEARRLIAGGGIKIDGVSQTDFAKKIAIENELILQKGKNKFVKFILK